jgi:hypothetical protein
MLASPLMVQLMDVIGINNRRVTDKTDQARAEFAAIESELEVIQKQLARLPTLRELARTALGIIFATMMLTTLSLLFFLR